MVSIIEHIQNGHQGLMKTVMQSCFTAVECAAVSCVGQKSLLDDISYAKRPQQKWGQSISITRWMLAAVEVKAPALTEVPLVVEANRYQGGWCDVLLTLYNHGCLFRSVRWHITRKCVCLDLNATAAFLRCLRRRIIVYYMYLGIWADVRRNNRRTLQTNTGLPSESVTAAAQSYTTSQILQKGRKLKPQNWQEVSVWCFKTKFFSWIFL